MKKLKFGLINIASAFVFYHILTMAGSKYGLEFVVYVMFAGLAMQNTIIFAYLKQLIGDDE